MPRTLRDEAPEIVEEAEKEVAKEKKSRRKKAMKFFTSKDELPKGRYTPKVSKDGFKYQSKNYNGAEHYAMFIHESQQHGKVVKLVTKHSSGKGKHTRLVQVLKPDRNKAHKVIIDKLRRKGCKLFTDHTLTQEAL